MAQHRYRHNKIKREHTIIDGILPVLEAIAEHPRVQSITPGRIHQRSKSSAPDVTFQYRTEAGIKLLARSGTAVQEVFVVTDRPEEVLADLAERRLVKAPGRAIRPERAAKEGGEPAQPDQGAPQSGEERAPGRAPHPAKGREDATQSEPGASKRRESSRKPAENAPSPLPPKKPEVGDAIAPELQQQMMSLARRGAGVETPAPAKEPKNPANVWRELLKVHRELLALGEPPGDLD